MDIKGNAGRIHKLGRFLAKRNTRSNDYRLQATIPGPARCRVILDTYTVHPPPPPQLEDVTYPAHVGLFVRVRPHVALEGIALGEPSAADVTHERLVV